MTLGEDNNYRALPSKPSQDSLMSSIWQKIGLVSSWCPLQMS
jgi:hypothetical protein